MLNIIVIILSWLIVAFGQAAWVWQLGPIAASVGFALFWFFSMQEASPKRRFWRGFLWFGSIQLVQLSWTTTHPYAYIYALLLITCSIYGAQFGWITSFITESRLKHLPSLLGITALWVFNEWFRLQLIMALPWNAVGLSLATTTYGLQGATLAGVYGLSFLVIMTNLLALRAYKSRKSVDLSAFLSLVFLPYLFGWGHLAIHEKAMAQEQGKTHYLLVQTAFPVEEAMGFTSMQSMADFVMGEWQQILHDLAKEKNKPVDFVVLPEYVVPFSVMTPVYRYTLVKEAFIAAFGEEVLGKLPPLSPYLAAKIDTSQEKEVWMVNNAYWIQGIANIFRADVVVGLEDRDLDEKGEVTYYSAGFLFHPGLLSMQRYEKRVLVPMGEYIPYAWCRELCRQYGIGGSFTPGTEGKALQGTLLPVGISICFEETLGHLMRENRLKGAEVHINLTNDGWYPQSRLPWQHFELSRLRTVEVGIPLVRACNTGVTAAVDSLGRDISYLSNGKGDVENIHGTLYVDVPNYTYHTIYTQVGDYLILGFSGVALVFWLLRGTKRA